ncbi:MAG: hypothetical protein ACFFFT_15825 [Candidatus Thorarchaeota archaeon]
MSKNEMESLVKEFLKNVKTKLPDWLKDKKEHKEILDELEDHIWSKAEELSNTDQPTLETIQAAIEHMGTPENIAKEYKRRGTPKVYITKELWPLYIKVLIILFLIVIAVNIIVPIINIIFDNVSAEEVVESLTTGIQVGLLGSFTIVTIIFVVLSMQGYFPEDFKSKKSIKAETKQVELAKERDLAYQTREGKPLKPFIKPVGEIIGGIVIIAIGLFLFIQPIPGLNKLIDPEFLLLVRFGSLFIITEGFLDMTRGLIGNRQISTHQIIHITTIIVKLSSISIAVLMTMRPEIFPIITFDETSDTFQNIGIEPEFYNTFRAIAALVITGIALSTIENFYNIYKLQKYKI